MFNQLESPRTQLFPLAESLIAARLELRRAASEYRGMGKFAVPLIVLIALLAPGLTGAQTPPQKVVVTDSSRSIASIDLFVAQERGFFRTLQRQVNQELGGK